MINKDIKKNKLYDIIFSAAVTEDGKLYMWGKILHEGNSCYSPEIVKSISGNKLLLTNSYFPITIYFF